MSANATRIDAPFDLILKLSPPYSDTDATSSPRDDVRRHPESALSMVFRQQLNVALRRVLDCSAAVLGDLSPNVETIDAVHAPMF